MIGAAVLYYDVRVAEGRIPAAPPPPNAREAETTNEAPEQRIISMPDKWEYPVVPVDPRSTPFAGLVDPNSPKRQLISSRVSGTCTRTASCRREWNCDGTARPCWARARLFRWIASIVV